MEYLADKRGVTIMHANNGREVKFGGHKYGIFAVHRSRLETEILESFQRGSIHKL